MFEERKRHTVAMCARLLDRFLVEPLDLPAEVRAVAEREGRDVVQLIGLALWDVFSQNHTVIDAAGTAYDLGSWRASGDFIAESINRRSTAPHARYGYLDFYMGTMFGSRSDQLRSIYRWIFAGLEDAGCDWIYSFPRLYVIDFGSRREDDDLASNDPSEAVRAELEAEKRAEETAALKDELDRAYTDSVERARREPLPVMVAAYRDVFGRLPEGWLA